MTYFTDLTPHTYTKRDLEGGVLNVGWLGYGHTFSTGEVPANFVIALKKLCSRPIYLHRGFHNCEFCVRAGKDIDWTQIGNGQIRICGSNGIWYSAPTMVHHYVTAHQYLPPEEFIQAVINPILIAEPEIEIDHQTWEQDIQSRFPDWQAKILNKQWARVKETLMAGRPVTGQVIARAPQVFWIDIGVGFPAKLSVNSMTKINQRWSQFTDFAPKGTTIQAEIKEIGQDYEIELTQI